MKRIPVCDVRTWSVVRSARSELSLRPSIAALLGRLGWSVVFASLAAAVWAGTSRQLGRIDLREGQTGEVPSSGVESLSPSELAELRESMRPEDFAVVEDAIEASRLRQHDSIRAGNDVMRAFYSTGRAVGVTIFGVLAAIPLLTFAFARLSIQSDHRDALRLAYWNYLPVSRAWPRGAFDSLALFVQRDPRGRWTWSARPVRGTHAAVPVIGDLAFGDGGPVFVLDRQNFPPGDPPTMTERVHAFVEAFERVTGILAAEPTLVEGSFEFGPASGSGMRRSFTMTIGKPEVTTRIDDSTDEIPPELRPQFDAMMARAREQGEGVYTETAQRFTITDDTGETRVYQSLDEMPPEIRERLRKHL